MNPSSHTDHLDAGKHLRRNLNMTIFLAGQGKNRAELIVLDKTALRPM